MKTRGRLLAVVVFAIAMAWVEAAVVLDLRVMINRVDPYQRLPLPDMGIIGNAELVREVATLTMLAAVGWLAGTSWRGRIGYAVIAFGVWDIFYYAFLRLLTGWPKSLLDWDVLFLLPLPWWGPVLAPVLISAVMIIGGLLMVQMDGGSQAGWPAPWSIIAGTAGILLALYAFLRDALQTVKSGEKALREMLPVSFAWPLFAVALVLMAVPVLAAALRLRSLTNQKQRGTDSMSELPL
ncbi:MAG TPA: hypothetical protein PLW35_03150 [Verrucomicrobiota bacterium]|nr:hypothetical protein [Verrucomicrobiota bacterium]HOK76700.1 hypothetical protein [Verrucomicrobiota bacterium]